MRNCKDAARNCKDRFFFRHLNQIRKGTHFKIAFFTKSQHCFTKSLFLFYQIPRQLTGVDTDRLAKGLNFSITAKTLPNKNKATVKKMMQ